MAQKLRPQQNSLYGTPSPLSNQSVPPVLAQRDPTTSDTGYGSGQVWVDVNNGSIFILSSVGGGVATWLAYASVPGALLTLSGDSGTASPSAGDIAEVGTANQIITAAAGSTVTWSIDPVFIAPGSIEATTTITADLGDITATNGNLSLGTAGNKINIATGANDSIDISVALIAGTTTVNTSAVTANSIIFLTANTLAGTPGTLSAPIAAIVPGVSFDIVSSSNTDTSTVNWWIIN